VSAAVGMRQNAPSDSTLHVRTISKEKCRRFLLERGFCSVLAEQDDRLRSDDSTDFLNLFARLRKGSRKTGDPARFLAHRSRAVWPRKVHSLARRQPQTLATKGALHRLSGSGCWYRAMVVNTTNRLWGECHPLRPQLGTLSICKCASSEKLWRDCDVNCDVLLVSH